MRELTIGNFTGFSRNFEMFLNRGFDNNHFLCQIFIPMVVELISAIHIPKTVLMINIFLMVSYFPN